MSKNKNRFSNEGNGRDSRNGRNIKIKSGRSSGVHHKPVYELLPTRRPANVFAHQPIDQIGRLAPNALRHSASIGGPVGLFPLYVSVIAHG